MHKHAEQEIYKYTNEKDRKDGKLLLEFHALSDDQSDDRLVRETRVTTCRLFICIFLYTAISINVVGSKYKASRQDRKIMVIFL